MVEPISDETQTQTEADVDAGYDAFAIAEFGPLLIFYIFISHSVCNTLVLIVTDVLKGVGFVFLSLSYGIGVLMMLNVAEFIAIISLFCGLVAFVVPAFSSRSFKFPGYGQILARLVNLQWLMQECFMQVKSLSLNLRS